MITIIVLCYNQQDFIQEFFATIKTTNELKFIFVDDASDDESSRYINMNLKRLELEALFIDNLKNIGTVASLKSALTKVDTEFVKFIAIDDPIDILEMKEIVKSEMNDVDLLLSPVKIIGQGQRRKGLERRSRYLRKFMLLPKFLRKYALMASNNIQLQGSIFRTKNLKEILIQLNRIKYIEDWPILLNIFFDPKSRVKFYSQSFSSYRVHEEQITNSEDYLVELNKDLSEIRLLSEEYAKRSSNIVPLKLKRFLGSIINWLILRNA